VHIPVIKIHGWPGISKVELEGSRAAWLIAQHSICTPDLQRTFLQHLSGAEIEGDVPSKQVALLTDRIRFNEGEPQIFGTVFDWSTEGELTCEVDETEKLDELREKIGLPPFKQSLQKEKMEVEKEGGKPLDNFKAYKQAGIAWAKSVGWQ